MMKKIFPLLVFSLLLPAGLSAQGGFSLKMGGNLSTFRGEETSLELGLTLGLSHEWRILKNTYIAAELLCSNRKGALEDKNVAIFFDYDFGHAYDIHFSLWHIDVPILVKHYWPISKVFGVTLEAGPSLSLGIGDKSSKERLYLVYNPDGRHRFDYVYALDPDPFFWGSSGFALNAGIGINLSKYSVAVRYGRAFHDIHDIARVALCGRLDTIHLLFGIRL